jgi:tRNA (cytidine/uridine-2'-O-)-methyltransferase
VKPAWLNVVLLQPEIPHNTGAIGRTCVCVGARLHLVRPLGFSLRQKDLVRAGLDYWPHLDVKVHAGWDAFLDAERPRGLMFASTKGVRSIYDHRFRHGDYVVFGSESAGLPPEFYERYRDDLRVIPMPGPHARSLNLANAASVVIYEAWRQTALGGRADASNSSML